MHGVACFWHGKAASGGLKGVGAVIEGFVGVVVRDWRLQALSLRMRIYVCCCRDIEIGEAGARELAGVLGGLVHLQSLNFGYSKLNFV